MPANTTHEVFQRFQPSNERMPIWRYMDLAKLIALLESRSLHFARADILGDPFEGAWTLGNVAAREQLIAGIIADTNTTQTSDEIRQSLTHATLWGRETTYVNCWHGGDVESAAMWVRYGTAAGSVVLQSTYSTLVQTIPDDVQMDGISIGCAYVGMVQYRDYSSIGDWIPGGNVMYPLMHKRKEFEHEREVRALIWTPEGFSYKRKGKPSYKPRGVEVPVDIGRLVETIRVQPTAPTWTIRAIESLLARYSMSTKVLRSQIDVQPMY